MAPDDDASLQQLPFLIILSDALTPFAAVVAATAATTTASANLVFLGHIVLHTL